MFTGHFSKHFLLSTLLQKSNTMMADAQTYDTKVMLILVKNIFI
jgi:hypothetical protein